MHVILCYGLRITSDRKKLCGKQTYFILNNVSLKDLNGWFQDTHQYFTKASPAGKGDYIEFIADMDLLVAMSTCPQGKYLAMLVRKQKAWSPLADCLSLWKIFSWFETWEMEDRHARSLSLSLRENIEFQQNLQNSLWVHLWPYVNYALLWINTTSNLNYLVTLGGSLPNWISAKCGKHFRTHGEVYLEPYLN